MCGIFCIVRWQNLCVCVCARASVVQVNGHLDYMRQMETILVAVGVPTKDHQGASFALPQPVTPAEGAPESRDRPPSKDLESAQTQNQQEEGGTGGGTEEEEEVEEGQGVAADGWDIPDISDLLDSLDEGDDASQAVPGRTSAQENTADKSEATALGGACSENSEDDGPESGHLSWSWEDTNWTLEQTHKKKKKEKRLQQKHPDL